MMKLKWTTKAISDVERLYEFLASVNQPAAKRAIKTLRRSTVILLSNPRMGEQLFQFDSREVRRILVGGYEIRYEIQNSVIYILRLWHTREDRSY